MKKLTLTFFIVGLFILLPRPASAAIAATTNKCTAILASATSVTCTLNATNLTSGSFIVCADQVSDAAATLSYTDPTNGTYSLTTMGVTTGARVVGYVTNTSIAASLVVTNSKSGAAANMIFSCQEYTGMAASSQLDAQAVGGPNSGAITTGAFTTTQASELIVGVCGTSNTSNTLSFSGYTQVGQQTTTIGFVFSWSTFSSIQTGVTATCTNTGGVNSSVEIATFKAAASGASGGGGFGGAGGGFGGKGGGIG